MEIFELTLPQFFLQRTYPTIPRKIYPSSAIENFARELCISAHGEHILILSNLSVKTVFIVPNALMFEHTRCIDLLYCIDEPKYSLAFGPFPGLTADDNSSLTTKLASLTLNRYRRLSDSTNSHSTAATDSTDFLLQPQEDYPTTLSGDITNSVETEITRITRTGHWIVSQEQGRCARAAMGYDVERFPNPVNDGLLCCICRDVLEEPLQVLDLSKMSINSIQYH